MCANPASKFAPIPCNIDISVLCMVNGGCRLLPVYCAHKFPDENSLKFTENLYENARDTRLLSNNFHRGFNKQIPSFISIISIVF